MIKSYHYWTNWGDGKDDPDWFEQVQVLCGGLHNHDNPAHINWSEVTCEDCLNHPNRSLYDLKDVEL